MIYNFQNILILVLTVLVSIRRYIRKLISWYMYP